MSALTFRDPQQAFRDAIAMGGLQTKDKTAYNYAGNWMYMHEDDDGYMAFKNIDTREYASLNGKARTQAQLDALVANLRTES